MVHSQIAIGIIWKGTNPSENEMLKDQILQDKLIKGQNGKGSNSTGQIDQTTNWYIEAINLFSTATILWVLLFCVNRRRTLRTRLHARWRAQCNSSVAHWRGNLATTYSAAILWVLWSDTDGDGLYRQSDTSHRGLNGKGRMKQSMVKMT